MKVYSVGVLTKGNPWYNNEPGVPPPPWARGSNIVKNGTTQGQNGIFSIFLRS